jgi:hypothetical protein
MFSASSGLPSTQGVFCSAISSNEELAAPKAKDNLRWEGIRVDTSSRRIRYWHKGGLNTLESNESAQNSDSMDKRVEVSNNHPVNESGEDFRIADQLLWICSA